MLVDRDVLRSSGTLDIDAAIEHHLRRVVRLRDGEPVGLTDGEGAWRLSRVRLHGSTLTLEPTSELVVEEPRATTITIATAMPKGVRLEWLVQKVTELGADRLMLLHAERSVVRWKPDRADQQRDRLQRIADEACRQSRRVWRLDIDGPHDARGVLPSFVVAEPDGRRLAASDVSIAIGPEGGWTRDELDAAVDRVSIGPSILRTETAAVAAAALCVAFDR